MPLRNRVTPLSELVADPGRGLVYGNRGCLHDDERRIRRHHAGRRWIACRLAFRGWHRHPLLQPGRFTELFFLDDATALAAGHRACALCRREDYRRLMEVWGRLHGSPAKADAIDRRLHAERLPPARDGGERPSASLAALPDGTFVRWEGEPRLVLGDALLAWSPGGYTGRVPRPPGPGRRVAVLTPPSLVELLRAGWDSAVTLIHPSALALR